MWPSTILDSARRAAFVVGLVLLPAMAIEGCTHRDAVLLRFEGSTMGTTYRILHAATDASPAQEQLAIDELLEDINASLSTYIETSLISRINASADTSARHEIDHHFQAVFDRSRVIFETTDGAFNPAVGPLVNAWGFGANRTTTPPDRSALDSLLALVDFDSFVARENPPSIQKRVSGAQLDFSAIAKGYGVDAVGRLLEERGVADYYVEIGGEVRTRGSHPEGREWSVGIERPTTDGKGRSPQIVVHLSDAALATSGNYRNYYDHDGRRYVHIINPQTGRPENSSLLSVSVLAMDCMTADAYATALMVMGLERAKEFVRTSDEASNLKVFFIAADSAGHYIEDRWPSDAFR